MKDKWLEIADKLDALTVRERGIIFTTLLVAVYMLFQVLLFDPLIAEHDRLSKGNRAATEKINKVRVEIAEVIAASTVDPNKPTLDKLKKQKQLAGSYQQQINDITDKLIEPAQMSALLASLLNKDSGLVMTAVKNVDAKKITMGSDAGAELFQHGLQLTMEGRYDQVSAYLAKIEALPDRVFWKDLVFQMDEYPIGTLTLEVYTLSTSKDLIGVYQ